MFGKFVWRISNSQSKMLKPILIPILLFIREMLKIKEQNQARDN